MNILWVNVLPLWALYKLPEDKNGCPENCRQIKWETGSDIWNEGSLPVYTSVTCTGLARDGKTDDGPAIQSFINNAKPNTAVYLPAGTYFVNSTVRLKSNVVLRGAGKDKTIITLGSSGRLTTQSFSFGSNVAPKTSYNLKSSGYALSGTPKKGDTTLSISSGTVNVGDWISVFADDDPSLVNANGDIGKCKWCADNTGFNLMQQIVQVKAKNGSMVTISKPLYYTPYTHPQYRKYTFNTKYAGFEDFKVNATGDIGSGQIILLQGALFCWVKGVETYNTGSSSGSAHIELKGSYGCEVRDSYVHGGRTSGSGANYGIWIMNINSDHKIENNIMRHNRHGIVFEGGGSGCAILYNYIDDNFTEDLSYLGSARTNHGAHPYMNLFEGNSVSHLVADSYWGSSSHFVLFRNHLWGDQTGSGVPKKPSWGFIPVEVWHNQNYYSLVGNVLGISGKWQNPNWSSYSVIGTSYKSNSMMVFGCNSGNSNNPKARATAIIHGNYDLKTKGVANWEGGSDHELQESMYYDSMPVWWYRNTPWPPIGPDVSNFANEIPAIQRFNGKDSGNATAVINSNSGSLRKVNNGTGFNSSKTVIRLYSLSGKLVKTFENGEIVLKNGVLTEMHRGKLSAGVYLYSVQLPNGVIKRGVFSTPR